MQWYLYTKLLIEIISAISTHPDLNLRLMKSFVESKLLIRILIAIDIVAQKWWLLEIKLLEGSSDAKLWLCDLWLVVLEKMFVSIGWCHVLSTARWNMDTNRIVIGLILHIILLLGMCTHWGLLKVWYNWLGPRSTHIILVVVHLWLLLLLHTIHTTLGSL